MRKSAEQEPSQELPDMDRALAAFLAICKMSGMHRSIR